MIPPLTAAEVDEALRGLDPAVGGARDEEAPTRRSHVATHVRAGARSCEPGADRPPSSATPSPSSSSVRSSYSYPRKEGLAEARVLRSDARRRAEEASEYRYPSLSEAQLDVLCRDYERVTGQRVRSVSLRRYIASVARKHGPGFLPLIEEVLAETGTVMNLLLRVQERESGTGR